MRSSVLNVSPSFLRADCELGASMRYPAATDRCDMFNWGGLHSPPPMGRLPVILSTPVALGGETPSPRKTGDKKNVLLPHFPQLPFIIIQKLVFNAMSSSNHVKVCMILILS